VATCLMIDARWDFEVDPSVATCQTMDPSGMSFEIEPLRGEVYEDRSVRDETKIEAWVKDIGCRLHGQWMHT
jgi:hypothetical protein